MSLKSIPVWESTRMATDAMQTAVGSVFEGREMYEVLDPLTAQKTIAHKEWLAFDKTITPIISSVQDRVISWHVESRTLW